MKETLPMTRLRYCGKTIHITIVMKIIKQLVIVCAFNWMTGLIYAASIRNPQDIDDIIDLDHDYLTYHPYHFSDDVITAQYNFRFNKGDNFVPLRHNYNVDLNAPMCYIDGGNVICELGTEKNVNFYHDDARSVAVAISNENGTMKMKGVLNAGNHSIDIEPLESDGVPKNRYHVIKKRWTANIIQQKASSYKSPYKNLPPFVPPRASSYCIDILCVVDYSVYRKFLQTERTEVKTMKKIRYYYSHVINGVNMRYASLTTKKFQINVRLAGYFIAKHPTDLPFIDARRMEIDSRYRVDSNHTLTSLDIFLKKLQENQNRRGRVPVLPDFNHAMLFIEYTSTNIGGSVLDNVDETIDKPAIEQALQHEATKDGVSGDKGGTSFVSGICSESKSTSLVVDHGAYTSAGIATHELGHNLGVFFHDGEGTARSAKCNASFNYIMAPASYLIDRNNLKYSFTFSRCSIDQIKKNLKRLMRRNRNCLQCSARIRNTEVDEKVDREFRMNLDRLPGQFEDVHTQCKQLYGKGSFMCPPKSPEEMCYRMYCYDPMRGACAIISEQMAAAGTPCGKYKICLMGKCIKDTERGIDTLDDCPYPDIPTEGAHCEDAMPYMCNKPKFRQKCCQSCNKKFTKAESCKDVHTLINGLACPRLMVSVWGIPGCARDYDVQNMCCISCKGLLLKNPGAGGKIMIHIGVGKGSGSAGSNKGKGKGSSMSSKQQKNKSKQQKNKSNKKASKYKEKPRTTTRSQYIQPPPRQSFGSSCEDSGITINRMTCPQLIYQNKTTQLYCKDCTIQRIHCCKTCEPFKWKYKC